jgi:pyruvate-formate lyase-activating enzyme
VATTIFLRGCSQGCAWCHNAAIQTGQELVEIDEIYRKIDSSMPFISAVVVSGGEPAEQPDVSAAIADYAHSRGLKAGLHSSGLPKENFVRIIEKFDFILVGGPKYDPRN